MITIRLQEMLDKYERNLAWVERKTGIAYSTLHKLNKNETASISFVTIDKLCDLFNCKPNDIIDYKKG